MQAINPFLVSLAVVGVLCAQSSHREAGMEAFNAGQYSVALTELTAAAADKTDATAQLFLALTQAAVGRCDAALPTLLIQPLNKLAGIAAVKCYAASGSVKQEFEVLAELEKNFPADADVLYLSAKQHMKSFNDATLAMFQRTPSSYRVHELSAEIFEVENRYDEAIAEYRKAIELNPAAPVLHFRLGRALLLASHDPANLEQAGAEFRSELKLSPEDASCEFQLGQIAQVETKPADARFHFEQALKLAPSFVQALLALGKLDLTQKQLPEAIELLSKATKLDPNNEAAHYALLTAYRDAGQMDKAKAEKLILDGLQKPDDGQFADFLKKLGEKPPQP